MLQYPVMGFLTLTVTVDLPLALAEVMKFGIRWCTRVIEAICIAEVVNPSVTHKYF